eukprot:4047761-Prymnesium_polylepis.1
MTCSPRASRGRRAAGAGGIGHPPYAPAKAGRRLTREGTAPGGGVHVCGEALGVMHVQAKRGREPRTPPHRAAANSARRAQCQRIDTYLVPDTAPQSARSAGYRLDVALLTMCDDGRDGGA